ncbi:alpha/beta hydrolase [Herbaspirillum sp. LeCh32-8]|uniref:alpha/beta fold hydrolase n=1 Tax=Herbaspirillum sp. LeCh32-8 TaxID=2821356 RepID=UPI001AE2AA68|nr:alpha/beta hydrolase [Herbaspirillum sp. LeCh32-8]MBP0599740.1 alpha/beta hydrolase [Herbaspirillum sp. LeCh32-8]
MEAVSRKDFTLQAGVETLACDIISTPGCGDVHTLFLHGAGHSTRQRQWPVREALARLGHASAAIDFSGHGDSSALQANSLAKRLAEAQSALDRFCRPPRTVVGVSMSGEIAMRLACIAQNQITHIVTIVGAIYDGAAFHLPFGPDFSAALRRPDSWRDAHVLQQISGYRGRITLVRAAEDKVIPSEIAGLIRENAGAAADCRIVDLPGVDHRVSERSAEDEALRELLAQLIAN